ncbi:hypothetical protein L6164_012827 [Bauhinia variegata]|uniref:Uncharacterized protein n=1 Tax=Bauhinia variegata TaxID=167791 RepID=A0ACB9PCR7_BAUVA|nr:hypothetical protein L6164_012827 [Bauhinia variegata]
MDFHGDDDHPKDHNPLTMSDEQILEQIIPTHHAHNLGDTKLDVDSLFILVENILKQSTHVSDDVVQGNHGSLEVEDIDDKFSSPLCVLKQIAHEMSCKPPGEEIAHRTTLFVLHKLSSYTWDAKAVLTLAAFALEYGDFWLLSQLQPIDPLAKSMAILMRVPVRKHQQVIVEINNLIKANLQLIKAISELEKLTKKYDTKEVPALALVIQQIPIYVYWAIITIVAVVNQIDCLTTELKHGQELSHFGLKIYIILSKMKKLVSLLLKQIEEAEYFKRLREMFQSPTEIVEVFKMLFFWKEAPLTPIYDGATKTLVDIDVLRQKSVFFFVSTLDITEELIETLKPIHEATKTADQYRIVWVPFVEEWDDDLKKGFEILKSMMPWYALHYFGTMKGFKFIKEEWHFNGQPIVVHVNPQGKVLHQNAFSMIQLFGLDAFPFTLSIEESLSQEASWDGGPLARNISPKINCWIKEDKYIFFYGGKDKEWIQEFTKYASALANDATIKEANISIELLCMENRHQVIVSRFWGGIESFLSIQKHEAADTPTQELQKLLSYKNESGWTLLSKGPNVVLTGHGTTVLKTLVEFYKWRSL